MQSLPSLMVALLIAGAAYADQPSTSLPPPSASATITSAIATGVSVGLNSGHQWYRGAALVGGITAVMATFIFALASRKTSA